MKKSLIIILVVFFIPKIIIAQDEQKEDLAYWYVSSIKVPWNKIDSLQKMVKKYTIPIVEEAKKTGKLLDYLLLIHHTGDEYNVVMMRKFPSWDAINDGGGMQAAMEKLFPDKEERDRINAGFQWILSGYQHIDNIYIDAMHTP